MSQDTMDKLREITQLTIRALADLRGWCPGHCCGPEDVEEDLETISSIVELLEVRFWLFKTL
jgi:hypothetical protein